MRPLLRLPLLFLSLFGLLVALVTGATPASAGVGTTGPEICKTEQGGRLAGDGTLYTEHNARCEGPESTTVTVSSKIFRNGQLMSSRGAKTCQRGTYGSTCKGTPGAVVRRAASDVICLQTTIQFVIDGRRQVPDKDTACITWSKNSVSNTRIAPLDWETGCEPGTLMYPYAGRVEVRHLTKCMKDVRSAKMSSVVSRNKSFNDHVETTGIYAPRKDCANPGSQPFSCSTTKSLQRRAGQLYCGFTHAEFVYKVQSQGAANNDGTKACWYF